MKVIGLSYLFVAIGGALGAMARYALNVLMQRDLAFPWGTLSANLLGCLAMGVVAQLVASAAWFSTRQGSFPTSTDCCLPSDFAAVLRPCRPWSWSCTRC